MRNRVRNNFHILVEESISEVDLLLSYKSLLKKRVVMFYCS